MKLQILSFLFLFFILSAHSSYSGSKRLNNIPDKTQRQDTITFNLKEKELVLSGPDGPYLFYLPDGKMRIVSIDEKGNLNDSILTDPDENFTLTIISHNKKHRFKVKLHPIEKNNWKHNSPEKLFVLGDPHGNIDCLVNILHINGVIGDEYEWTYGKNHLMIEGDIFDRGDDVVQILWLVYKLEAEALKAGGKVSFIYGNHELLVMANDLRYTNKKYTLLAEKYKTEMEYPGFFGSDTELGQWLAKRNTIEVIGKDLFVHAGLSKPLCKTGLTIPQINEEISRGIYKSKEERNNQSVYSKLLFTTNGPVWYRGLVNSEKEEAITEEKDLNQILDHFGITRIIVGHTIFDDITTFFNGKVIAINVNNLKNWKNDKGRGILIKDDKTYITYGDGRETELK